MNHHSLQHTFKTSLYRAILIFFIIETHPIYAFTTTSIGNRYLTPVPSQIHHQSRLLLQTTTNLLPTSSTSLYSAADVAVNPIVSAIYKKDEITAIEALFPFLNHLFLTPYQIRKVIVLATKDYSQVVRILMFAVLAYLIPYTAQYINFNAKKIISMINPKSTKNINDEASSSSPSTYDYFDTNCYHITNHIRQGLLLGAMNNLVDCILDGAEGIGGVKTSLATIISNAFTSVCFTIWAMFRMKCYKNLLIDLIYNLMRRKNALKLKRWKELQVPSSERKRRKRRIWSGMTVQMWKEITNYVLYFITGIVILDLVGVKYSIALRMISYFGTVGTLVVGLSSKEIAAQIVSGIQLASQRPFKLGDTITYGNNSKTGTVVRMDLLYTTVKGKDEIRVKIPNSDLNYKTFSNLSRVSRSQVYQKLRFQYDALDTMPELIAAIKSEIKNSCPMLITDGSSPWNISFSAFGDTYLEVIVDAKLQLKADSNEYYQVKEDVLNAIGRAAKSCDAKFYVDKK